MSDPNASRDVSVTIKVPESKKYANDNPWIVFKGSVEAVAEMVAEAFGIEAEGLSLIDITLNAQAVASGLGAASQGLGGTVLSSGSASSLKSTGDDPWAKARKPAAQEEKPAEDPILVAIENAKNVDELKQLWAENQDAFKDDKYMSPWKAKGLALS